jgi:hypothetical protein
METVSENKLSVLFDSLLNYMIKDKIIKPNDQQFTDIIFKILSKKEMNRSKLFANSALFIDKTTVASGLLENGLIQISAEGQEKYSLTFKGIAEVLRLKYNISYEKQFSEYLNSLDKTYSSIDQLSTLSLILIGATSVDSAVILEPKGNIELMTEVFQKTLECLKKYRIINTDAMLTTGVRGEAPVLFLINRLQDLSKKTNHYYRNPGKSVHYFEIEEDGQVSKQKVLFLLKKTFCQYDLTVDYSSLSEELQSISNKYFPGFIDRKILQKNIFIINECLQEFAQDEVHRLPQLSSVDIKKASSSNT